MIRLQAILIFLYLPFSLCFMIIGIICLAMTYNWSIDSPVYEVYRDLKSIFNPHEYRQLIKMLIYNKR